MGSRRLQIIIDTEYNGAGMAAATQAMHNLPAASGQAAGGMQAFGNSSQLVNDILNKFIGAGALMKIGHQMLAFGQQSINVASSLDEQMSKFQTVFRDQADGALAALEEFANATGRSSNEFIGFAATLQDTFVPLGFARDQAADMSVEIVKLATDLSSFNNIPVEQVVRDMQSALVGNTETLRKYGVVANETSIKQEAFALGLYSGKGNIDANSKAQAILSLAIHGTSDAQGDAIRTGSSYENQQRSLQSATVDLQVAVGHLLMPFTALWTALQAKGVNMLTTTAEALTNLGVVIDSTIMKNKELAEGTDPVPPVETVEKYTKALAELDGEFAKTYKEMDLGGLPVMAITEAIMLKLTGASGKLRDGLSELVVSEMGHIDASQDVTDQNNQVIASLEASYGAAFKMNGSMVTLNGQEVINIDTLRVMSIGLQESTAFTHAFGVSQIIGAKAVKELTVAVVESEEENLRLATAAGEASDKQQAMNNRMSEGQVAFNDSQKAVNEANAANDVYFGNVAKNKAVLDELHAAQALANEETRKATQAMQEAAAVASGDYFTSAMKAKAGQGLFNQSLASLGERYVSITTQNEQQAEDLANLQGQYEKATSTIHDYEVGVKGLGMEEDERNKKIQEQLDLLPLLEGAMAPLAPAAEEYARVNVEATINQKAVNEAIYDAADAAGSSATELALLGGALGLYSEEAVDAAIKSALIQGKIKELAQAYSDGQISVSDMKESLNEFIVSIDETAAHEVAIAEAHDRVATTGNLVADGMNNAALATREMTDAATSGAEEGDNLITSFTPLPGAFKDAAEGARDLASSINAIQDKVVTVTTNFTESGTPYNAGSGPDSQKGGGGGAHFSLGGTVVGGIVGLDSVPATLTPGEEVLTVSEAKEYRARKAGNARSGSGDSYYISTTDPMPVVLEQIAQRQKLKSIGAGMG